MRWSRRLRGGVRGKAVCNDFAYVTLEVVGMSERRLEENQCRGGMIYTRDTMVDGVEADQSTTFYDITARSTWGTGGWQSRVFSPARIQDSPPLAVPRHRPPGTRLCYPAAIFSLT